MAGDRGGGERAYHRDHWNSWNGSKIFTITSSIRYREGSYPTMAKFGPSILTKGHLSGHFSNEMKVTCIFSSGGGEGRSLRGPIMLLTMGIAGTMPTGTAGGEVGKYTG